MEKLHKIIELSLLDILLHSQLSEKQRGGLLSIRKVYLKSVGEKINAMSKILHQHFPSTIILPPYHIT